MNIIKHISLALSLLFCSISTEAAHTKTLKHIPTKIVGTASWYGYESGKRYQSRPKTANGEYFNPRELTAAHKTLPFGSKVLVTNMENKKSIVVRINDRGPFIKNRIIDLSKAAASAIGISGVQLVQLKIH